jgi:hypothetical protein
MKAINLLKKKLLIAMIALTLYSCIDNDGYSLDNALYSIATVNPLDISSYSLTLDDGTTLWPIATDTWYKPDKKTRALVVYTLLSDEFQGYDHAVKILDIKNILTKATTKDLGEDNDTEYGNDPIQIINMWVGDGYLNVEFGFNIGNSGIVHYINLVKINNVNTPYYFELRHNAYGDSNSYAQKGIVAFDLSDLDTQGNEVTLTIKVNTFEGEKTETIVFNAPPSATVANIPAGSYNSEIK